LRRSQQPGDGRVAAMRWSVSAYATLVIVVALTGCSSPKVEEYRREANSICATAKKRLGKEPKPSTPEEIARKAKREIAVRQDAINTLGELRVPLDLHGANSVIHDLEARQERARAVEKAAKDKDRAKLRELEHHEHEEAEVEVGRAREVGLHDCAEL
jgi:hypothetical protein